MTINTVVTIFLSVIGVIAIAIFVIYSVMDVRESLKACKDVDKVEKMELPRLKSCPFCGGEAKLYTDYLFSRDRCTCYIKCQTCKVKIRDVIDENQDGKYILNAIEIWNTRKDTKE